jgi:hypothetical protein
MSMRGANGWVFARVEGGVVFARLETDGRIVELYMRKGDGEITPTDLRRLPLTRLRALAATRPDLWLMAQQDFDYRAQEDPGVGEHADPYEALKLHFPPTWVDGAATRHEAEEEEPAFELTPISAAAGLTDQFLRDVARAYSDARSRGLSPNVALAEQAQAAKRTVEKWVWLARKKGYLPPTRPGRVG